MLFPLDKTFRRTSPVLLANQDDLAGLETHTVQGQVAEITEIIDDTLDPDVAVVLRSLMTNKHLLWSHGDAHRLTGNDAMLSQSG